MATTLQRADINDSTYHNNPYRKNPYYNPFFDIVYCRLLSAGAKAVALDDALFTSAVATDTERTVA